MSELTIRVHALPSSHPCRTVIDAVRFKGFEPEVVVLAPGEHIAVIQEIYGEDKTTAPGLTVEDRHAHGSLAALALLEELFPDPTLYPPPHADRIRDAERWGDAELQNLGRWLVWGSLYYRPEYVTTFAGAPPADEETAKFARKVIAAVWPHHGITEAGLAAGLEELPAKLDHVDSLIADGVLGREEPNAADLQIGATLRIMLNIGDVAPLLEGRPAERMARRFFPDYDGEVPAGAFPEEMMPPTAA